MNAIVSGKVEKPEGSMVFKSELVIDLSITTKQRFEYYFDSLYTNVKYYLKLVTVPNDENIIATLLTPIPYTQMTDVQFRVFYEGAFRDFTTDVIIENNLLTIYVKYSGKTPSQVFSSVEIGTLEII